MRIEDFKKSVKADMDDVKDFEETAKNNMALAIAFLAVRLLKMFSEIAKLLIFWSIILFALREFAIPVFMGENPLSTASITDSLLPHLSPANGFAAINFALAAYVFALAVEIVLKALRPMKK